MASGTLEPREYFSIQRIQQPNRRRQGSAWLVTRDIFRLPCFD